jgi:carbonic anhydrase/acetyltransferase-like protein (isoleucine patch superfamily)
VGTGAEIPARHLAAGSPAKIKKELEGESLHWIRTGADHYVELSGRYRELFPEEAAALAALNRRDTSGGTS